MATNEMKVAIESVVHDAMRQTAQAIWDKHHIFVRDVSFKWLDVSTSSEQGKILTTVDAHTTTEAERRNNQTPLRGVCVD
jgi:hypothetical protein